MACQLETLEHVSQLRGEEEMIERASEMGVVAKRKDEIIQLRVEREALVDLVEGLVDENTERSPIVDENTEKRRMAHRTEQKPETGGFGTERECEGHQLMLVPESVEQEGFADLLIMRQLIEHKKGERGALVGKGAWEDLAERKLYVEGENIVPAQL